MSCTVSLNRKDGNRYWEYTFFAYSGTVIQTLTVHLSVQPSFCMSIQILCQCNKSSQTTLILLNFTGMFSTSKSWKTSMLTFLTFQTMSSSTYLVSTITLSGICGSFQNFTGMFPTSNNISEKFNIDFSVSFQTRSRSTG